MSWIAIAAVFLAVAAIVLVKLSRKGETEIAGYPYQRTEVLFTPAERSFFGVLNLVVGENAKIFGKVRVADVMAPKKGLSRSDWQKAGSPSQKPVTTEKVCPKCTTPMVIRVAKKGSNAGKQFWACSAYPKCKHIEAINS